MTLKFLNSKCKMYLFVFNVTLGGWQRVRCPGNLANKLVSNPVGFGRPPCKRHISEGSIFFFHWKILNCESVCEFNLKVTLQTHTNFPCKTGYMNIKPAKHRLILVSVRAEEATFSTMLPCEATLIPLITWLFAWFHNRQTRIVVFYNNLSVIVK